MHADDQRRADALNDLWDAIQRGELTREHSPDVSPFTRQLMGRLRARKPSPDLDPARERVWQDLRQRMSKKEPDLDATLYPPGAKSIPIGHPETNGRVRPAPVPHRSRSFAATRRWLATTAATAIMLLVTLAAIYFALVRDGGQHTVGPGGATPTADWPTFRGNPAHTGVTTDLGITGTPQIVWTFGAKRGFTSPAIVDEVVYALSNDGVVHALDTATGNELWAFAMGVTNEMAIGASPTVDHGAVYVGGPDGVLYALDAATGTKRWAVQIAGSLNAAVVAVDGVVFVGSTDGNLYALAAGNGEERWRFASGPLSASSSSSAPAVADGTVYVVSDDGTLYAVDTGTGNERWHLAIGGTKPRAPVVAGSTVYTTGDGAGVVAVDIATGTERWRFAAPGSVPPAVSDETLYVAAGNEVYALDTATGAVRWHTGVAGPTSPVVAGNTVYGTGTRGLYALDATTGTLRWQLPTASGSNPPAIAGGMVFVAGGNGMLTAVGSGVATPTP